jgi:uncharacterized protein (TIGR02117 family)
VADVLVYLTATGWHTGLILPTNRLGDAWRPLLRDFTGADHLWFGWGQRAYYMAREPTIADAVRALLPGPAVVLVTPLHQPPRDAIIGGRVFPLGVTRAGFDRLADYVWAAFARSPQGELRRISDGLSPGGVFYEATGTYSAAHTCNSWTAEGLRVGGLPVTSDGVVLVHQLIEQVEALPAATDAPQARRSRGWVTGQPVSIPPARRATSAAWTSARPTASASSGSLNR